MISQVVGIGPRAAHGNGLEVLRAHDGVHTRPSRSPVQTVHDRSVEHLVVLESMGQGIGRFFLRLLAGG